MYMLKTFRHEYMYIIWCKSHKKAPVSQKVSQKHLTIPQNTAKSQGNHNQNTFRRLTKKSQYKSKSPP